MNSDFSYPTSSVTASLKSGFSIFSSQEYEPDKQLTQKLVPLPTTSLATTGKDLENSAGLSRPPRTAGATHSEASRERRTKEKRGGEEAALGTNS